MNDEIVKLAELNKKINSFNEISNVKQVFEGVKDQQRDPIIDKIMAGKDVYFRIYKLAKNMSKYYLETYGQEIHYTNFIDFIEQIVRILLKNFMVFDDIQKPRAYMISYLFKQKVGSFDNRILAYFNRYYPKYFEPFKNHKSYEQLFDNQMYDQDDLDYWESNKFYADYHEFAVNSKDNRSKDGSKKEMNEISVKTDLDDIEEKEDEIWYINDDDILSIPSDKEIHATLKNTIITKYDVPFKKYRIDNIALSEEEYGEKITKIRERRIRRWHIYKTETGFLPHDIVKYRAGGKYFLVRNDSKSNDFIYIVCEPEEFDFTEIFFDKRVETYLRNIIIRRLSETQQLLIGYLYYQMKSVDEVIKLLGYANQTAMNKEKNRSLGKLRRQILNDYDFIMQEYDETKLAYWAKKIKQRHENSYAKKEEKMLSI